MFPGVGMIKRKLANTSFPIVELVKGDSDGEYVFKSQTVIKNSETKFKLGVEFEEERLDGKMVKVTIRIIFAGKTFNQKNYLYKILVFSRNGQWKSIGSNTTRW